MFTTPRLVAIALCAALNFAIGVIVHLVKLPIFLDSIGTILCVLLIGPDRTAAICCAFLAGIIGVALSLGINPYLWAFTLTVLAIVLISSLLTAQFATTFRAQPLAPLRFFGWVIVCGVITGIVSAILSAPVVVYIFGGVTGSGSAFVVAFFLKTGEQLLQATLFAGLTTEPVDKTLQVLLAALLYRATPREFIAMLRPAQPATR